MLKNIGSNWMVTVATVVVTFALTPFVIHQLGADLYGVWLTITAMTAYLLLIQGGLPAASVRYLSQALGSRETSSTPVERVNRVVHSCVFLYGLLGLIAAVVGLLLFGWFEVSWDVPAAWAPQARLAFLAVIANIALGFVAHLPFAVMESHDEFVVKNWIVLGGLAIRAGLTVALLLMGTSILYLAIALLAMTSFQLGLVMITATRRYPGTRFGIRHRDGPMMRSLLTYSAWVLVLAVGGQLAFSTDAIVISWFLAYDDVSVYSVANSIVLYMMEFIAAIAIVVMPKAARLRAAGEERALHDLFLQWSKGSLSLALLIGSFLLFLGPEFITWWIDDEFGAAGGPVLQILVVSFLFFLPMRGAAVPVLMGVGNVAVPAMAFIVMGVVNIGVSIALVGPLGILGAALGTAVPNVLFAAVVFQIACREVGVRRLEYLAYVPTRALVGMVPVVGWLALCRFVLHAEGFWGLLYSGVVTVAIFAVSFLGFVYRGDPYADPLHHPRLQPLLARIGIR